MYILNQFKKSAKELSHPYSLCAIGMLLALRIVLGYFGNLTLAFAPSMKFGFAFIPLMLVCIIYGPVAGACVGGLGDIISYILSPQGAYFPGFTISGILTGILFGLFLYKNNCTIVRLLISYVINAVFIHIFLGTLWLNIAFGLPFLITLGTRALQALILAVPEILITLTLAKAVTRIPQIKAIKNK